MTKNSEIAIVGMGPTGTTLANLLANRGISVSIFEKQETTYPLPRAVHFDGEVMRVFQSIGLNLCQNCEGLHDLYQILKID